MEDNKPTIEEAATKAGLSKMKPGMYRVNTDGEVEEMHRLDVPEFPSQLADPHPILSGGLITEPALLEFSSPCDELIKALAMAQAKFGDIEKKRTGKVSGRNASDQPYSYEYKYADISDVLREVRPKLAKQGIVVTQMPVVANQKLTITTMLMRGHQWMRNELTMSLLNPGRANPNQVLGGQITYLRRYPLCAMVGVQAEEDLDAQESNADATGNQPKAQATRLAKPKPSNDTVSILDGCIDAGQQQKIKDALAITGISIQKVVKHLGDQIGEAIKPQPQAIPADQFDAAMSFINTTVDEGNA